MPAQSQTAQRSRRNLPIQIAILALTLGFLTWRSWPEPHLRVIFLETNGDATLIQTPAGGYVLIDGGGDPATLAAALGRQMPFWRRSLEAVVLTAPDGARLPGQVAALARYRVGLALAPPVVGRGAYADEWRRLLGQQRTPVHTARAGQRLDLGGATLRVLAAGDGDEAGMILRLDYGATSVVFDQSGGEADEELLSERLARPASLLAFPWQRDPHIPFVTGLRPRAIVFTDGQQADRPVEQTFAERAVGGAALYHERLGGTITWVSDGVRAWVKTER
jgi:beta-lactamase superfamily II metal-dependent hydrolase